MKTILAPIDFSPVTGRVISTVWKMVRPGEDRVVLLHVLQIPTMFIASPFPEATQLIVGTETDSLACLDELARTLPGVSVLTRTATGEAAREILREARTDNADFIVMGSHGHTALYELVVGSTTREVVKKAICPILIVPAGRPTAESGAPDPQGTDRSVERAQFGLSGEGSTNRSFQVR